MIILLFLLETTTACHFIRRSSDPKYSKFTQPDVIKLGDTVVTKSFSDRIGRSKVIKNINTGAGIVNYAFSIGSVRKMFTF